MTPCLVNRSGQSGQVTKPAEAGGDGGDVGKEIMIGTVLIGGMEASPAHPDVAEAARAPVASCRIIVENDAREVPTADEEATGLMPMEEIAALAEVCVVLARTVARVEELSDRERGTI